MPSKVQVLAKRYSCNPANSWTIISLPTICHKGVKTNWLKCNFWTHFLNFNFKSSYRWTKAWWVSGRCFCLFALSTDLVHPLNSLANYSEGKKIKFFYYRMDKKNIKCYAVIRKRESKNVREDKH